MSLYPANYVPVGLPIENLNVNTVATLFLGGGAMGAATDAYVQNLSGGNLTVVDSAGASHVLAGAGTGAVIPNAGAGLTMSTDQTSPYGNQFFARVIPLIRFSAKSVRVITAAGAIVALATDTEIIVEKTVGAATALTLPPAPTVGQTCTVTDGKGDAGANNITVSAAAGNINGAATLVMSTNYGRKVFIYDGTEWIGA